MKKKDIEIPETTDFSAKAFKKLQRELALARAEIAYLNFFVTVMLHGVNWQCSGR